jgi:macrocin-O-methyltransferase TylF-like protien
MKDKHESGVITLSDDESLKARTDLFELFNNYPATDVEKERSLGLFIRGSLLARIFGIRELYEKIVMYPGVIVDLGTWRGQTAVICENLRAIFEPLHLNRRIICFDTFEGYKGFSEKDKATELHKDGTYNTGGDYSELLNDLLILHEKNNAMGHNFGKHKVIKGDCRMTVPKFFQDNSNEVVALAFFDVNAFEPTAEAFALIYEKLVPGGIIAFWQLTREATPAEGMVYAGNILNKVNHTVHRSQFYPGLCYIVKK